MIPLLKLLRPHQWIKSVFVLAGLIFSHEWSNLNLLRHAILAAVAFSLLASAVYIFNDVMDRKADSLHPLKKLRPLATGSIGITAAIVIALLLAIISLSIGLSISFTLGWILVAYASLNIAYSLWLKRWIIIDVFVISAGFLLRVLAGTIAIGIMPSNWLLLCTLMLTLFLGFCKRRSEQQLLFDGSKYLFKSTRYYPAGLLDKLISITATGAIISYTFYTLHQDSLFKLGITKLSYTVPLVIYGIFRYLYLLDKDQSHYTGSDMAYDLFRDRQLLIVMLLWLAIIISFGINIL